MSKLSFRNRPTLTLIIPMGAPWSVYDHELIGSWVLPELAMLRTAHDHGYPCSAFASVASCSQQRTADQCPGRAAPEIGWVEIDSEDESLVPSGSWFQWHYDRWELPEAATELARNPQSSQAFILDRNLAVQFHPEMNSEILATWIATGGADEIDRFGMSLDELVRQTADRDPSNREQSTPTGRSVP